MASLPHIHQGKWGKKSLKMWLINSKEKFPSQHKVWWWWHTWKELIPVSPHHWRPVGDFGSICFTAFWVVSSCAGRKCKGRWFFTEGKHNIICTVTCDLRHCFQTGRLMSGANGSKRLPLKGNGGYSSCWLFVSASQSSFSVPIFLHSTLFENRI